MQASEDATAYFVKGNDLKTQEMKQTAIITFNIAIQINPRYIAAYDARGNK